MLFTVYDIDRRISGSLLFQESCLEFMNFAEDSEESKRGDKADGRPREAQKKQQGLFSLERRIRGLDVR